MTLTHMHLLTTQYSKHINKPESKLTPVTAKQQTATKLPRFMEYGLTRNDYSCTGYSTCKV